MIRRLVEDQEVGQRNEGTAHRHAPLLAAGKRFNAPVSRGTIQRDIAVRALVERPAFERHDAMFQFLVPLESCGSDSNSDQIEDRLCASRMFSATDLVASSMKSCGR